MTQDEYKRLKRVVVEMGYEDDIKWAQTVKAPTNARDFASEYIYVVCNSGMKAQIARTIFDKVMRALEAGKSASTVFGHVLKCKAIDRIWRDRDAWFLKYNSAKEVLVMLRELPFIGAITVFHLAKNFGVDCVKPDRHLVRIARNYGFPSANDLCAHISKATGDKVSLVDLVLWRAANLKLV